MTRRALVGLAVALACVALPGAADAQATHRGTLVMPFANPQADPRLYWLAEGSAVLVSRLVEEMGGRTVARDERLRAFERLQLPPAAALSHATVIKVGQLVRAGEVIVGEYELVGEQLTIRARVIRLDTGRLLPEVVETGPLVELMATYTRGVRAMKALTTVPPSTPLLASPPAFEAYVKGLIAETPATQLSYLEQAYRLAQDDAVRLALADVLSGQGNHERAISLLAAVPPSSRWRRQARYRTGLSLIALKRHDEAFDVLLALEADARSAAVLNALGVLQLRRGVSTAGGKATYYFSQACEADPEEGDYFFNLGYAYWLDRDPQAAIYWLREAVRRDPTDVDAHDVLGAVLQQTGAAAESARERELARRLSASSAEMRAAEGSGEVPRGLERLNDRLDRGGSRVDSVIAASGQRDSAALAAFHLDAARRAFKREADREAEQELRRALYLSPYLAEAHLLLGRIYLRGGRAADAVDALKIALWSEETSAAHIALAEAYMQLQDTSAARTEVERALALEPTSTEAKKLQTMLGPRPPGPRR